MQNCRALGHQASLIFLKPVGEEERCQKQPLQGRAAALYRRAAAPHRPRACAPLPCHFCCSSLTPSFLSASGWRRQRASSISQSQKARAGTPNPPLSACWGGGRKPPSSHFSPTRVRGEPPSRRSHFARPGALCCGRARRVGAGHSLLSSPAPHSWLNILPVSSPAVLGCRQPLPRHPSFVLAGKASSRLPGLSPEPHLQSVTFTAFSSPYQTQSTRPDRGKGLLEVPDGREAVPSVISGKGYFQAVNLFNVPLLEAPALGVLGGEPARGRCCCSGSGFLLAVGFWGCFFFFFFLSLSVLNKALKWEVDRMVFITVLTFILIHFRN